MTRARQERPCPPGSAGNGRPPEPAGFLPQLARPDMTADDLCLLQDLRRSVLYPPRQLRPRTGTATQACRSPIL